MSGASHKIRLLTGGVLLLFVFSVFFQRGRLEFIALCLIAGIGLWEFYSMFTKTAGNKLFNISGLVFTVCILAFSRYIHREAALYVLLAAFWFANMYFLFGFSSGRGNSYGSILIFPAGLLYLPFSLQFFFTLQSVEVLLVLGAAFVSDTGAYYAGSWFGKSKIWPIVSPKKTFMGSLGGLVGCLIWVVGMGLYNGSAPWWSFALLAVLLNIAAQFGDFFESALKRTLDVKDTGKLLPGHGGLLDRIDSLLFVLPVYALADTLIGFFH